MIKNINKISIIGGPGTGKSTLSNNLGKVLNLPVYHIDGLHYLENWQIRDKNERDQIILDTIKNSKWIMDGTYHSTLEMRVQNSDMIIFLDFSMIARLKGILSRYFKNSNKEKPEIPGCKEQLNLEFIKFTINWNKTKGKTINSVLEKYTNKKILVFKNRKSLNKWYEKNFGKKIKITI